MGYLQICS